MCYTVPFAERRIGQHHVEAVTGVFGQAVIDADGADRAVLTNAILSFLRAKLKSE
jgi:hypothetical protein